jgi:hypothetical protein
MKGRHDGSPDGRQLLPVGTYHPKPFPPGDSSDGGRAEGDDHGPSVSLEVVHESLVTGIDRSDTRADGVRSAGDGVRDEQVRLRDARFLERSAQELACASNKWPAHLDLLSAGGLANDDDLTSKIASGADGRTVFKVGACGAVLTDWHGISVTWALARSNNRRPLPKTFSSCGLLRRSE